MTELGGPLPTNLEVEIQSSAGLDDKLAFSLTENQSHEREHITNIVVVSEFLSTKYQQILTSDIDE